MKRRVRGIGWLVLLAAAGIVVSLSVDQDPVRALIGSPVVRLLVKLVGMGFSAGVGVFSYYRSEKRHAQASAVQSREKAVAHMQDMLVSAIQNIFRGEKAQNIRANVMVAEGEELRMLASANMDVFPDFKVRLHKGQGCAGVAWERAINASILEFWTPLHATQAQLTRRRLRQKWHLTEDQIARTAHILWILTFPLFLKTGDSRRFVGVLNFDGVHEPLKMPDRLRQPDFVGECLAFGDNIVEVAAEASLWPVRIDTRESGG